MNTYILVITLIFNSGYAGMGGLTSIEVDSLESCQRIGQEWKNDIIKKLDVIRNADTRLLFTCIKK